MTDNPFDLLEAASDKLKGQSDLNSLENFKKILEKIKEIIPAILKNPTLISLYIYQLLRFLQQINYSIMILSLEDSPEQENPKRLLSLLPIITALLISILKSLMKGTFEIGEICGREFLRFSLDHSLVSEFPFSTDIKNYTIPPKNEFIKTLIPNEIQRELDESLVGKEWTQAIQNLKTILDTKSKDTIHFLICDIIRYVFSAKRLPTDTKAEFIKSLLTLIPNWKYEIYTFEICIVLFIDIVTFQRQQQSKEDDSNIRVCFKLIREFPLFLTFVENLVKTDQLMLLFLAEAATRCDEQKLFENITLPAVEPEAPKVDTREELKQLLSKLKWQRKADGGSSLLSDFASQVIHNLQPCFFEIPFKTSDDLQVILDSGNPSVIASVCEKDQNVFKMALFALADKREIIEKVLEILMKTEIVKTFMLQSFAKVLVIAPNILPSVMPLLPKIPKTVDPTPFLRYMSYNLTNDEIIQILNQDLNSSLFPTDENFVENLIRSSLNWKETAQTVFWMIIVSTAVNRDSVNAKNVFSTIEKLLSQIVNFPVVFIQIRLLLQKMKPTPMISKLADGFMKGSDKLQNAFIIMVSSWFKASQDDTVTFLQGRLKSFKTFFTELSDENKKKIPELLRQRVFAIK